MKSRAVKELIQKAAVEEFSHYPESFPVVNKTLTNCGIENIAQWSLNMWDSRTDDEISRDFILGLNIDNYTAWAFEAFKKNNL